MIKIGLISDTHGYFDPKLKEFFADCNEIWHSGDIGNISTAIEIESFKPLRAVYGNIDGQDIRSSFPQNLRFNCEGMDIWITHIGGYPGNYDRSIKDELRLNAPDIFIAGHSHILKIMPDKVLGLLHINPGAAGNVGSHRVKTAVRFIIDKAKVVELEVLEISRH